MYIFVFTGQHPEELEPLTSLLMSMKAVVQWGVMWCSSPIFEAKGILIVAVFHGGCKPISS